LNEIQAIDFFPAAGGKQAEALLSEMEAKLRKAPLRKAQQQTREYSARTWVTRKGIHVDRLASAWLIRRFIDKDAQFKFVAGKGYRPEPGEVRFDMFDAEFTHEGDLCTFEVLIEHPRFPTGRFVQSKSFRHRCHGNSDARKRQVSLSSLTRFAAPIKRTTTGWSGQACSLTICMSSSGNASH
jgi:hypothetical protein